jgi:hypothetical protein
MDIGSAFGVVFAIGLGVGTCLAQSSDKIERLAECCDACYFYIFDAPHLSFGNRFSVVGRVLCLSRTTTGAGCWLRSFETFS